jgi:hypothetical protein
MSSTNEQSVRIFNGALSHRPSGILLLRGEIDATSLTNINVDEEYQRKVLHGKKEEELQAEFDKGGDDIGDIRLCVRGVDYEDLGNGLFVLKDAVYVTDGLQRLNGAVVSMTVSGKDPWLGAHIRFDSDYDVEQRQFIKINFNQTTVGANVRVRNMRRDPDHQAIGKLYALAQKTGREGEFVLAGRVQWEQHKLANDLITGVNLIKVAGMLHSHAGPGRASNVAKLADGLEVIMTNVGPRNLTANVKHFFGVLDKAFGVKDLDSKASKPHLNATFMLQLAALFSDCPVFWEEDRKLVVESSMVKKLGSFNLSQIGAQGTTKDVLYTLLAKHLNSGRRNKRLKNREGNEVGV